jgi:hypothetical protein
LLDQAILLLHKYDWCFSTLLFLLEIMLSKHFCNINLCVIFHCYVEMKMDGDH